MQVFELMFVCILHILKGLGFCIRTPYRRARRQADRQMRRERENWIHRWAPIYYSSCAWPDVISSCFPVHTMLAYLCSAYTCKDVRSHRHLAYGRILDHFVFNGSRATHSSYWWRGGKCWEKRKKDHWLLRQNIFYRLRLGRLNSKHPKQQKLPLFNGSEFIGKVATP